MVSDGLRAIEKKSRGAKEKEGVSRSSSSSLRRRYTDTGLQPSPRSSTPTVQPLQQSRAKLTVLSSDLAQTTPLRFGEASPELSMLKRLRCSRTLANLPLSSVCKLRRLAERGRPPHLSVREGQARSPDQRAATIR